MITRLSIHLVSIGRPTLARMLASVIPQCDPSRDEILLVGEPKALLPAIAGWARWPAGLVKIVPCRAGANWGHSERNATMYCAKGTHLVFADDDDAFLPGALEAIRAGVADWPGPVMFRLKYWKGGEILWREPDLRFANVGTAMFVVPNRPDYFGRFGQKHGGDFEFIAETVQAFGGMHSLRWNPAVIYGCRQYGDTAA